MIYFVLIFLLLFGTCVWTGLLEKEKYQIKFLFYFYIKPLVGKYILSILIFVFMIKYQSNSRIESIAAVLAFVTSIYDIISQIKDKRKKMKDKLFYLKYVQLIFNNHPEITQNNLTRSILIYPLFINGILPRKIMHLLLNHDPIFLKNNFDVVVYNFNHSAECLFIKMDDEINTEKDEIKYYGL